MSEKRRVRENKTRQDKIKEALAKKPTVQKLNRPIPFNSIHRPTENTTKKIVRNRPLKATRQKKTNIDPDGLIYASSPQFNKTTEYPTPDWFHSKDQVDISIIIPLYKSASVVKDLINSWDFNDLKHEIIFVDDNCPQNSKDVIVKYFNNI